MAIIQDWKIRSTHARCDITGETFLDGQEFYTCIFDDPGSEGFNRRDYSVEAWKKIRKKIDPAPFSFWKSTYKAPLKAVQDKNTGETSVEGMLRHFIDEDDPLTENARYILALMLERKKTLIPTDSKETDTRTLLFYEHADNGDVFIVADPGLRLDEIESVQREVVDLLAAEDRRLAGISEEATEPTNSNTEENENESEDYRDQPAETEEETVGISGHEAPDGVGLDTAVNSGEEFSQDIHEQLKDSEGGENPASPDY